MATLYKRPRSPFWWIRYREKGVHQVQKSTGLRWGDPDETQKAKLLKLEKLADEARFKSSTPGERFSDWAMAYIEARYSHPLSLAFYKRSFRVVLTFLESKAIFVPRQVTYQHVLDFLDWRQKGIDESIGACGKNTALQDLKILRILMGEAIRRGFASANPILRLGIKLDKAKEKPEITDLELAKIRKALATGDWPAWMTPCFEIAIRQGCRLMETRVPLADINLDRRTITFDAKGDNIFTTELHSDLVPLIRRLKASGATHTLEWPVVRPSIYWGRFFRKIKLKHLCFHCCRVTVITRLARAGVPLSQAMRFVGHASEEIHRVYQRLSVEDVSSCVSALKMGKPTLP